MGVAGLWKLLDEHEVGKKGEKLSKYTGQSWAIDLSSWIVHGRTGGLTTSDVSPVFKMIKTVFYRAQCLLKHGIKPIFVLDGLTAPNVKAVTLQDRCEAAHGSTKPAYSAVIRDGLREPNTLCRELLESMGLEVITSSGEAEKTCAYLNCQQVVNVCLCDDGDAFLYGAKVVCRNFDMKDETVDCYSLEEIEKKLNITQRDMVLFAVLAGCDYCQGVKNVGPKTVLELIQHMKSNTDISQDVLSRVLDWRENTLLIELQKNRDNLSNILKIPHCSLCQHPGSKSQHSGSGCTVCATSSDCKPNVSCTCDFHIQEQKISCCRRELDIRDKALKQEEFPFKKVVVEFLSTTESFAKKHATVILPRWNNLANSLRMTEGPSEALKAMMPALVHMNLHGWQEFNFITPNRIIKDCIRRSIPCYQVQWKRFEFDIWTPRVVNEETPQKSGNDPYVVNVPSYLFDQKYPDLAKQYNLNTTGKKKGTRKQVLPKEEQSQATLDQFFQVKKRLKFTVDDAPRA